MHFSHPVIVLSLLFSTHSHCCRPPELSHKINVKAAGFERRFYTPTNCRSPLSTSSMKMFFLSLRSTWFLSQRFCRTTVVSSADVQIGIPMSCSCSLKGLSIAEPKYRRPQSNGFVERLHRTLLDEHFRSQGRQKLYETVEEMQKDLDAYLNLYNLERTHQGRNMNSRTPYQVFIEEMPKKEKPKAKKAA